MKNDKKTSPDRNEQRGMSGAAMVRSLALGTVAVLAGQALPQAAMASHATAQTDVADDTAVTVPMVAPPGSVSIQKEFEADILPSLTVGTLMDQVGELKAARPILWCGDNYCFIIKGTPKELAKLVSLPDDLKITNDMTLTEAMNTINHSKYKGSGIFATLDGLKLEPNK